MAATSLDGTLTTEASRPPNHRSSHSDARGANGRGKPALGRATDPWRELQKLGLEVSERTVSRLVRRRNRPPSQTWRTFLTNHVTALVSMDFFTVPTLTGRVLFVLVLLSHARRRIVHWAVTDHPTALWAAQQVVEAFRTTALPDGCCEIATRSTATCFGAAWPAWAVWRESRVQPVPGRILMRSA